MTVQVPQTDGPCVYGIYCTASTKIYVGLTRSHLYRRWQNHEWSLNNGSHNCRALQDAWNSLGERNFEVLVLHTAPEVTLENVRDVERHTIAVFRTAGLVYNQASRICHFPTRSRSEQDIQISALRKELAKLTQAELKARRDASNQLLRGSA